MRWAKSLDSLSLGESLVLLVLLALICTTEQKLLVTASVSVKVLLVGGHFDRAGTGGCRGSQRLESQYPVSPWC